MTKMAKENKKFITAIILASLASFIWAYNYILAKQIAPEIRPIDIGFWRWVIAAAVLYPFARPHFKEGIPKIKQTPRIYFYMGFLAICVYNILFFTAAHHTSANNIAVLGTTSFIWTIVVVAIVKIERITIAKVAGCLLAFAGALEVVAKGNLSNLYLTELNWGDLMMILASVAWGIYAVLVKKRPHQLNQLFLLFVIALMGLIPLTPLYLANIYVHGLPEVSTKGWLAYIYVGVFVSAVSWACYNYAIEVLGPVRTSVFFYLLPIMVAVMSALMLDESIKQYHIIGFALVISGIVVSNMRKKIAK